MVVVDSDQGIQTVSTKDHEGMRSADQATIDYVLSIMLKSWTNTPRLASVLSTESTWERILYNDGAFGHDEAHIITMASCVIQVQTMENM